MTAAVNDRKRRAGCDDTRDYPGEAGQPLGVLKQLPPEFQNDGRCDHVPVTTKAAKEKRDTTSHQSSPLVDAEHHVHVLHRLAGRSIEQIVEN